MTRSLITRRLSRFCLGLAGFCLLLACTSVPSSTPTEYLLRADHSNIVLEKAKPVWFRELRVAPYLRDLGIAVAVDDHEIVHARSHLWAEPLAHGAKQTLAIYLEQTLGRPVTIGARPAIPADELRVSITQMHGATDGQFILVANVEFIANHPDDDSQPISERLNLQSTLQGTGYPELVETHKAQLNELARLIAGSIGAH